ncbi:MAG: CoA-transferase, partial [Chloroflexota bacterium]|nr:CoA-transferase [Chloroflexota bacterium]
GGPSAVITTLAVLGFTTDTHEMELQSWHPGASAEQVRAQTGWDLRIAADARETLPPTRDELRIIREIDPDGFWTR